MKEFIENLKSYWVLIKEDPLNIYYYIQGNIRMFLWNYFPLFIRNHIKEQFLYRKEKAYKCTENKSCLFCGCKTPELYFSNKECKLNIIKDKDLRILITGNNEKCYNKMLNKKQWKKFKNDNFTI